MSVLNQTVLEKCWIEGSNDFQQRIPNPSISGYARSVDALFQPYNHDLYNEFSGMLVGLMGTYVNSKLFENPLRELKKPAMQWGNTAREVAVKYLKAHTQRFDSETLLKVEKPEYVEWFYSVQNPRRYEFSWSKYELQRVFSQGDSYAFDDLLSATLTQMYSSDNYDEMQTMIQMFAEADNRFENGLFRYSLSAAPTDEATSKELLTAIRGIAGTMKFPTELFNAIDVPVFESADTLVLWVTPWVLANIDVQALSAVFQLDKAEIKYRIIEIPEFPIPNVYAALTSEDFIYCRDVWYGVEPPFYNPENMTSKYYLQHSELVGANPCAMCCLFSTDAGTNIPTITVTPSTLAFSPATGTVAPGGELQTKLVLSGSVTSNDAGIDVEPDAATYELACDRSGTAVPLNTRTYVDDFGVLHVQKTGLEAGDVITITATTAYHNPSGANPVISPATFAATIV